MSSSRDHSFRRRTVPWLLAAAVLVTEPLGAVLEAQSASGRGERRGWTRVRVAKWALFGTAVAFGGYALSQSKQAEDAYGELRQLCRVEPQACEMQGGNYSSARAEELYQSAIFRDRRARVGIFGGQVALLGSVALFIYDLGTPRGPVNIPYPGGGSGGLVAAPDPAPGGRLVGVGVRIAF